MRALGVAIAVLALLAPAAIADTFRVLDDDADAMQARVDMVEQAGQSIDTLYFLARNDRVTLAFLALLRDARRRGVPTVRIVVDANFQHIPKAVLAHLREEGVQIRVYHPLSLRHPSWIFRRMHDKLLLTDRQRYLTGGRNLAESYFGLAKKKNYIDRDVYVDGASAAEASDHFERTWNSRHVRDLKANVSRRAIDAAGRLLDATLRQAECEGLVALQTGRDWSDGAPRVESVRYFHDFERRDEQGVAVRLAEEMSRARKSIIIESPYLVPSSAMRRLLAQKRAEGVYIQVVTNSFRSTDGLFPHVGYLKYRHWLRRSGIDVREFKGPDTLHSKTMIIDGETVVIGTFNIDPRSEKLNTEVMCATDDRTAALDALDSIDAHIAHAWKTGQERISIKKRVMAWMGKLLLPFIEKQL